MRAVLSRLLGSQAHVPVDMLMVSATLLVLCATYTFEFLRACGERRETLRSYRADFAFPTAPHVERGRNRAPTGAGMVKRSSVSIKKICGMWVRKCAGTHVRLNAATPLGLAPSRLRRSIKKASVLGNPGASMR